MAGPDDPFGTAGLRGRVLDAWAASPARFREDANAEDDLVRGGYRDRVVVELAQNAADAAARSGVSGRLRLALEDDVLIASNTGAALDAAGVESLATLRASAKRGDRDHGEDITVGRFGVGFAAVLAVTDAPEVASTTGAVRWDAGLTRAAVAELPSLADEAGRRHGQLPVLRLPWPSNRTPDDGYDTTVRLPLRDPVAVELVRRLLADVDDALLLALPALAEVAVEVDGVRRVVADAGRWQVVRRSGPLDPGLLADRPVEERDRPSWTVAWARPLAGQPVPDVLHAPTATDEPLELPAMLIGSFPLEPSRRHVAPGPLTDFLVGEAAASYAELAAGTDDPLALLPTPVPVGRLDGAVRAAVTAALADAPLLRTTDGSQIAPRNAVAVVGAAEPVRSHLAEALGPLVPDHPALDRLGGRRLSLAEAVESLAGLDRPPTWWRELYDGLSDVHDPDVLGVLPVPLADGRLVRGPRGVLLPDPDLPNAAGLDQIGLRLVHPEAAHSLLRRAGAADAGSRTLLESPELRAAVEHAWDDPEPLGLADLVLPLVAAAGLRPGELTWLAGLPLPDERGDPAAADELALPGSLLAEVADADAVGLVADTWLGRWGPRVLEAVGVLGAFTVSEHSDVLLDPSSVDEPLTGWVAATVDRLGHPELPPSARAVSVIPELDVVADEHWPTVLRALSDQPQLRAAVLTPVRVELGDGRVREVPSYASWLLRARVRLAGRPATDWALPGSDLEGLYDGLAGRLDGIDPAVLAAAGLRTGLEDLLAEPDGADELLDRLADQRRPVTAAALARIWTALAALEPDDVTPPERVRVRPDRVADAAGVVVVDRPEQLQVLPGEETLVVPLALAGRLAEVLDLDLGSEVVGEPDLAGGTDQPVPDVAAALLDAPPAAWRRHDRLAVDEHDVTWWRDADGVVHATGDDGLARGLAAACGRWEARLLLAAALAEPDRAAELAAEGLLEG